jgi:glycosyltransferase involved in cell wall biosynthesis
VRVGRRLGIPVICHVRLPVTERFIRNYDLQRADRIVVVSQALAEPFRAWPDFDRRVRVVYNGLDVKEWCGAAGNIEMARKEIRRQLSLPPDAFLVGQIGLISRRKQQHLLVEAAQRLAARRADCHFLIVGDPSPNEREYAEEVAMMIETAGLSQRVTIWPFRREIEAVFAALDLNLLISSEEGFGRVAIEAGAFGIPTVGTRIGGIPEVVADGETGLLAGVNDPEGLADAIERLMADAALRREMGEAARRRVESDFSIEVHTRRMIDVYEQAMNERE